MNQQVPKVQINTTSLPSERIIQKERTLLESEVIDANGRIFKLRLPEALDELDLHAALGREHSANIGILVMATPLIFIESIDGIQFNKPTNYGEIRAAIKRIGKVGMNVLNDAILKYQQDSVMSQEDIENIKK